MRHKITMDEENCVAEAITKESGYECERSVIQEQVKSRKFYIQGYQRLILQILGPKEQDLYRKATSLVMVDSPSQLARAMVNLLCKCGPNTPLNGCCGEAIIMSFLHSIMLRCRSLQSQRTQTQQQQVRGSLRGSCTL